MKHTYLKLIELKNITCSNLRMNSNLVQYADSKFIKLRQTIGTTFGNYRRAIIEQERHYKLKKNSMIKEWQLRI